MTPEPPGEFGPDRKLSLFLSRVKESCHVEETGSAGRRSGRLKRFRMRPCKDSRSRPTNLSCKTNTTDRPQPKTTPPTLPDPETDRKAGWIPTAIASIAMHYFASVCRNSPPSWCRRRFSRLYAAGGGSQDGRATHLARRNLEASDRRPSSEDQCGTRGVGGILVTTDRRPRVRCARTLACHAGLLAGRPEFCPRSA